MPSPWNRFGSAVCLAFAACASPVAPLPGDCPTTTTEPAGPWANTYGGNSADTASALAATPAGDLLVGGSTRSFGASEAAWVLKLGRGGEVLWSERFEGPASVAALAATRDGGAVLASDSSVGTIFERRAAILLARLDCAGGVAWSKSLEIPESVAFVEAVRETADGGFLIAGTVASSVPGTDCLVVKTSADGTLAWQRAFGRPDADEACHAIALLSGGGAILAGEYERADSARRRSDVWLMRLGGSGAVEWERTFGERDVWERRPSIREVGDGTVLVSAMHDEGAELLAIDGSGAAVWQRRYESPRRLAPFGLWASPDGAATLVGTIGPDAALEDVWALRVSAVGDPVWSKRYRRDTLDRGEAVTGLADGRVFVAGTMAWGSPAEADEVWVLQPAADGRVGTLAEEVPIVATRMNVAPIDTAAPVRVPPITTSGTTLRATPTQAVITPVR